MKICHFKSTTMNALSALTSAVFYFQTKIWIPGQKIKTHENVNNKGDKGG